MSEQLKEQLSTIDNSHYSVKKMTCILCNKKLENNKEIHKCLTRGSSQRIRVYLN
jgi:hypothetical protein